MKANIGRGSSENLRRCVQKRLFTCDLYRRYANLKCEIASVPNYCSQSEARLQNLVNRWEWLRILKNISVFRIAGSNELAEHDWSTPPPQKKAERNSDYLWPRFPLSILVSIRCLWSPRETSMLSSLLGEQHNARVNTSMNWKKAY